MNKDLILPEKGSDIPRNIPVVLVTPEQAKQWLDTRFKNERPIHKNKVRAFARDMVEGNWHFLADTIRFSEEGRLMDGQHRLSAVVESGTAQWFPIINLPEEVRPGIDTGSARTLGELLHYGNHVHGRILAAIVRRVLVFRNGTQSSSGGRYLPTHTEGVKFVQENEALLRTSAEKAYALHKGGLPVAPSSVGAAYFLCAKVNQEEADVFFDRLITGMGLTPGDPVAAYRSRAIKYMERNRVRITPDDAFRFAIVAWNHVRNGNKVERLLTPREGWTTRNVPIPR